MFERVIRERAMGYLFYLLIGGGISAIILKVRRRSMWWAVPLSILGLFGPIIAIAIGQIPGLELPDDDEDGFAR